MVNTAGNDKVQGKMFRATMVALIVIFLVAIGGVMLKHYQRIKEQKALYAQYLSDNAWIAPSQAVLDKMDPILKDFEALDESRPPDWKKIDAEYKQFLTLQTDFAAIPLVTTANARYAKSMEDT